MTNYILEGIDLSNLFDTSVTPISFSEDPRTHIPSNGSIIYSVWDRDDQFIYVGISGTQKSLERRNPVTRMQAHASGRRSGDQFCVYVHDFYVIPKLVEGGSYSPERGGLDNLTKKYIHENLFYRFVHIGSDDSDVVVRNLEDQIKSGVLGLTPVLNGTTPVDPE